MEKVGEGPWVGGGRRHFQVAQVRLSIGPQWAFAAFTHGPDEARIRGHAYLPPVVRSILPIPWVSMSSGPPPQQGEGSDGMEGDSDWALCHIDPGGGLAGSSGRCLYRFPADSKLMGDGQGGVWILCDATSQDEERRRPRIARLRRPEVRHNIDARPTSDRPWPAPRHWHVGGAPPTPRSALQRPKDEPN